MNVDTLLPALIANGRITDPQSPRGKLLAAAARQFRRKGFAATTVRDLAAEVGILSGSIFHHVKSKEEILFAVMLEITIILAAAVKARVALADGCKAKIHALIHNELSFLHGDYGDATAVLLHEWRSLSAAHQLAVLRERERYDQQWEEILAQARAEGLVDIEPAILRQLIHGTLAWSSFWYTPQGSMSLDQLVASVMQLVLGRA